MDTQATIEQWQQQLDAVRARARENGAQAGVVPVEQARSMRGLDIMQALLEGRFPYPPIAETLDFHLVEVERGVATFQGMPQQKHLNPMGTVHGAGTPPCSTRRSAARCRPCSNPARATRRPN